MFWLLEIIIKILYMIINRDKQIVDKPMGSKYSWDACSLCKTQLNDKIYRYDDKSFCIPCHEEIALDSD